MKVKKKISYKKSEFPFVRKVANGKKGPKIKKKYTGFSLPPHDEEEQNRLIVEMVNWAEQDETALDPDKFPVTLKISPYKFYKLSEKNEFFAEGLALAKYIIGVRMKELTRDRKLDKDYLFRFLPLYHPEFREWSREKRLSSENDNRPTEIIVNVTGIPSSPLVKDKEQ